MIESELDYYKKSLNYNYFIKSLSNDYDLITFYYQKFNHKKIYPIHSSLKLNLFGYDIVYFIDILDIFPVKKNVKLIKLIKEKNSKILKVNKKMLV